MLSSIGLSRSQNALNEIKSAFGFSSKDKKTLRFRGNSLEVDKQEYNYRDGKTVDDMEQSYLQNRKNKTFSLELGSSDGSGQLSDEDDAAKTDAHKRSSLGNATAYSPVIARKDLACHPFSIPPSYPQTPSLSQSHGALDLCHLDLAQYRNEEDDQEEKKRRRTTGISLGEMEIVLRYVINEELLGVTVHDIGKFLLPSPSVIGTQWTIKPIVTMSLLPDKRKFFECKQQIEIKDDTTAFMSIKCTDFKDKTLRLTVFDSRRRSMHLPVGHVLIPLREMDKSGRVTTFARPLTCYSEPAGFNKGKVELSVNWVVSAQKLELKISRAFNLKSPRGVLGRDFFFKLFVYIGDNESKTFKTIAARASPDVEFKEKFVISLTLNQLKDASFVFCLYAKHLVKLTITSEYIGSTVIGPYMPNRSRALSQWEKMITSPFEEITERHTLYI